MRGRYSRDYPYPMNHQKMVIGSVLFLVVGLTWIVSFWNGSLGFSAAHPVAGSKFSIDIAVTGWPALGGVALTILGAILLLLSAVLSVIDLATARQIAVSACRGRRDDRDARSSTCAVHHD